MHKDSEVERFGSFIEGKQGFASKRRAVDMRSDFDSGKAQRLDLLQLAHRARHVLYANHSDAGEVARRPGDHGRDLVVHDIGEILRIVGRQPMRQQFRHRRQHLHVSTVIDHVRQPSVDIPGSRIDFAKYLARDHHRGLIAARELNAGPPPVPLGIGSQSRRHNMGVNIDHSAHRVSP